MPLEAFTQESTYLPREGPIDIGAGHEIHRLRVNGTATGATVMNLGPAVVENALTPTITFPVSSDGAGTTRMPEQYGTVTTVAVNATQVVAPGEQRDFWTAGSGVFNPALDWKGAPGQWWPVVSGRIWSRWSPPGGRARLLVTRP